MLAALALGVLVPAAARAQTRLDAHYVVSLAGIPLGEGDWAIDVGEDRYSATVRGETAGLLKTFASASGNGGAQGRIANGQLVPATYSVATTTKKKTETIRISLAGGNVKDFSIVPEEPPNPERIPVSDAHKQGVLDPMTASLIRLSGNGATVGPDACRRATSVFDGRMRYELRLDYKRMDTVKGERGYQGPAVVCAIYFTPVSGYVPSRPAIKYLAAQRDMEVWLAPIGGTRILVPFRVKIPTPIGTGVLEATKFVVTSAAIPQTATKTQ